MLKKSRDLGHRRLAQAALNGTRPPGRIVLSVNETVSIVSGVGHNDVGSVDRVGGVAFPPGDLRTR
jgi:hypothetical protein